MLSVGYVVAFVAFTTLPLWHLHYEKYQVINSYQLGLTLFHSINFLICLWELALYYHQSTIQGHFAQMFKSLPKGSLPKPMFLFEEVKLQEALTLRYWSKVWSTYSLMDPSYSDPTTFGFWIDVGNGHVMLIPSLLFMLGLTYDILPARVLGCIGLVASWQMFYGTVLYFSSYFYNQRHKGRTGLPLVIISNGIWMVGPLYGMYTSYQLINQGTYDFVRT